MRLVEIRHLEGPNLFLNQPAIKLELEVEAKDSDPSAVRQRAALVAAAAQQPFTFPRGEDVGATVLHAGDRLVLALHRYLGLPEPVLGSRHLELPGHCAIVFSWQRRSIAQGIAQLVADLLLAPETFVSLETGEKTAAFVTRLAELGDLVARPADPSDAPELIPRRPGQPRIVAVTGTNGKTTTTRLIAYILRRAGYSVGWTSTAGVYVNGKEIEVGDWSGPGGAHLLLNRDDLDWAILETARGGILRRGLAFSEADVTVFINVSADHIGGYGILSVEGIAEAKAVVSHATAPDGLAVLNADDPLVMRSAPGVRAPLCLVSQNPTNPLVIRHEHNGGLTITVRDGTICATRDHHVTKLADVQDVPITFHGRARHMVENVLCAVGAALGCGIAPALIGESITSFGKDPNDNPGRLATYNVRGVLVLVDYAHNEAGLIHLLNVANGLRRDGGELWTIVGTAGDRSDEVLRTLGRLAAERSDYVIAKDSPRYRRGRIPGTMQLEILNGVAEVDAGKGTSAADEVAAIDLALNAAKPGDVIAVMASDMPDQVRVHLEHVGQRVLA